MASIFQLSHKLQPALLHALQLPKAAHRQTIRAAPFERHAMTIKRSNIFSPQDLPEAPSQYDLFTNCRMPAKTHAEDIVEAIERTAVRLNLPVAAEVETLAPASFFGLKKTCVIAWHPNPPRDYYSVIIEPHRVIRGKGFAQAQFWLCGESGMLDVMPGRRMQSMYARIMDEASLKRPEDWVIIPEYEYYQRLFDVARRALTELCNR